MHGYMVASVASGSPYNAGYTGEPWALCLHPPPALLRHDFAASWIVLVGANPADIDCLLLGCGVGCPASQAGGVGPG